MEVVWSNATEKIRSGHKPFFFLILFLFLQQECDMRDILQHFFKYVSLSLESSTNFRKSLSQNTMASEAELSSQQVVRSQQQDPRLGKKCIAEGKRDTGDCVVR